MMVWSVVGGWFKAFFSTYNESRPVACSLTDAVGGPFTPPVN